MINPREPVSSLRIIQIFIQYILNNTRDELESAASLTVEFSKTRKFQMYQMVKTVRRLICTADTKYQNNPLILPIVFRGNTMHTVASIHFMFKEKVKLIVLGGSCDGRSGDVHTVSCVANLVSCGYTCPIASDAAVWLVLHR